MTLQTQEGYIEVKCKGLSAYVFTQYFITLKVKTIKLLTFFFSALEKLKFYLVNLDS